MKRILIISVLFLLCGFGDVFGTALTYDFSGTLYDTDSSIQGFLTGDKFSGSISYDYDLASYLIAQQTTYPAPAVYYIPGALKFSLYFSGYTTDNYATYLLNGSFYYFEGGQDFVPPPGLQPLYYEDVFLNFSYNDDQVHNNSVATLPNTDIFFLTSLDIISGVEFTTIHGRIDEFYIDEPQNPVPEPCTLLLLAFGLAGVGFLRKKTGSRLLSHP